MNIRKLGTVLIGALLMISIGSLAHPAPIDFNSNYSPPGLEDKVPEGYIPPGLQKKLPAPAMGLIIGGQSFDLGQAMLLPNGRNIYFPKKKITVGNPENPDYEVEIEMLGDIDPFISYTFSAINYTDAPISFSTTGSIFLEPNIVNNVPNTVYASLGASITDLMRDGVSITSIPTAAGPEGV